MRPYRLAPSRLIVTLVIAIVVSLSGITYGVDAPVTPANNALAKRGFDHFYNMEYDKAIHEFETLVKEHPDDAFANNYLVSALVFKELYRIGAMNSETYANNNFLDAKAKRPLDPATQKRIKELITRTEQLTSARLQKNPNDVDALYARGVARAMRSTFMGMGEKAWLAAVRSALAARRDHERVLELDPNYVDAKMAVGVHNYIIGSLNWAARTAVALIGVGGNKQKGLQYLRDVAKSNTTASIDAKIALALFLRREQKYPEALEVVHSMMTEYPHSFLMAQEYADLLTAAGRGKEAIVQYESILTNYKKNMYPFAEPQHTAWGLGVAARGQREFQIAADAFDQVSSFPDVDPELAARSTLAAAQMYDLLKKRDAAVKRYQLLASRDSDEADLARRYLRQPYKGN